MKKMFLVLMVLCVSFSLFAHRSSMSRLSREAAIKTNNEVMSFEEWYYVSRKNVQRSSYWRLYSGRGRSLDSSSSVTCENSCYTCDTIYTK